MAKKKKSKKSGVNQKKNHNHAKKQMAVKDFSMVKNSVEKAEAVSEKISVNEPAIKDAEKLAKAEIKKAEAASEKAKAEIKKAEAASEKAKVEIDLKSKKPTTKKSDKN